MATIFFPSTMNFYTRKSLVLQCPFSVVKLKNYTFQYFPGIGLNMEGGVSLQCLMSYVMIEFDFYLLSKANFPRIGEVSFLMI